MTSPVGAAVALARPRLLPFVLALMGLGYGFAHWDHALPARAVGPLLWCALGWTLLHAGTLWLNALLDQDEGEVLLGAAVRPPPGLGAAAWAALAAGVGVVAWGAVAAVTAASACAALAVLYSHPSVAWKGHPVWGPAVNVLGYGVLTPWAGFAVVGVPAGPRGLAVLCCVAAAVLGCTFVAQAFQEEEDRARGYRTWVAVRGAAATVDAARAALFASLGGVFLLAVVGWLPRPVLVAGLGVPALGRALGAARRQPRAGGHAAAVEVARRLLHVAAALFLAAFAAHALSSLTGGAAAGLATAGGHPTPVGGLGATESGVTRRKQAPGDGAG